MNEGKNLSHVNEDGKANMVDVSGKPEQLRIAKAHGFIRLQENTVRLIRENQVVKGDVLSVAEVAGIMAAKKTPELIPLCHPLMLSKVEVHCTLTDEGVAADSLVKCTGQTGVEMEALTTVSVALLTIYDMVKAVDKQMIIQDITLTEKQKHEPIR
jgi:cyclic pyranopterin monophosphate synthase